jgi:class I fructose-bisphosphate aldolase
MGRDFTRLENRIAHVIEAAFAGRRLVVFSGGPAKRLEDIYDEVRGIHLGGGHGSIVGRNSFQRPRQEALEMLRKIVDIYLEAPSA